ncbi:MAG: NADH:flavin oxidoreductase [Planctomycetes bacterium]|nr:NADH:flavin oxidoreductase [Planctomycetota bacterium]
MHPATRHLPTTTWPTREQAAAAILFSSASLGPATTRTRTWVPAMVPWRASETGDVTPAVHAWYARFAQGLPGVLVVEATGIRDVPSGPLLRIGDDRYVPGLRELTSAVREASGGRTKLLVQLIDFLAIKRRPEPATFFRRHLAVTQEHRARLAELDPTLAGADDAVLRERMLALSASRLASVLAPRELDDLTRGYRERITDTHLPHIAALPRELPPLFAAAARRAEQAGFDGVELHYAHAYTMASFLSRLNTRTDGYGGALEHRARLAIEVFQGVRAAVSSRFVVGCRLLGDEVIDDGSRIDDAIHHSLALARAGIDFVSVSKGGKFEDAKEPKVGEAIYPYTGPSGHECMPTRKIDARGPFGRNLHLARAIRDALRAAGRVTPVVGAGGINSFELAEDALRTGACDFVASARQSLADPDWWRKMELGRGAEVRRCVFTNYCEALDQRHEQVTCQLWDRELDAPDPTSRDGAIARSHDGRRRLVPPAWDADEEPRRRPGPASL